ncbi:MAG: hypothetical protein IEMM0008_0124 [bacterium]|nr:MAG: hypothetical protein IEMM0008_0124 [bacterium]
MKIRWSLVLILSLVISSCHKNRQIQRSTRIIPPSSESKLVKLNSYDPKGNIKTIITGQKSTIFKNSKEIWVDKLRVLHILYKKNRKDVVYVELTSDKGIINYKTLDCEAWSNVVLKRDKEVRIETERVYWNHKKKIFKTEDEEEVVSYKRLHPEDPNDSTQIRQISKKLEVDVSLNPIKGDRTVKVDEAITIYPKSLRKDEN